MSTIAPAFAFDTSKPLLPMMPVTAFKPKDAFGDPQSVLDKLQKGPDGKLFDGQKVVFGYIAGTARKIAMTQRIGNDGVTVNRSYCVDGTFRAIPADRSKNPQTAPRGWFPPHVHAMFAEALRDFDPLNGEQHAEGAEALDFNFEVAIVTAQKSSARFTWSWVPLIEVTAAAAVDPLAHLMAAIPSGFLPAPPRPEPVHEKDPEAERVHEVVERQEAETAEAVAHEASDAAEAAAHKPAGKGARHK